MDGARILDAYNEIKKSLPRFNVAYAIKANPHENILSMLRHAGSHFETASYEEIRLLLEMGIEPERIIFSNPVKPVESIDSAVKAGITTFTFDSIEEAKKFIPYRDKARLVLRLDVPNKGALWALDGKFGASRLLWPNIFSCMQEEGLPLAGVTFHVGSQCETLESWEKAMEEALVAIETSYQYNLHPDLLNIGGGFPIFLGREVPSVDEIGRVIHRHLKNWTKKGIKMNRLLAEPGRFICGAAGTMETKIIGIADRESNGKLQKWVFLDAGVFTGLMETIDEITYPVLSNGEGELIEAMLCGPSCDSADKMFKAMIPSPKIGDTLYLSGAGAYSNVYASRFNGLPIPEIVFMDSVSRTDEETVSRF